MTLATIPVSVVRKRLDGKIEPFTTMQLTRVPCIGEHLALPGGPLFRVTGVTHIPVDATGSWIAEVRAVESAAIDVGFEPR
jgi:hypothetical protein